MVGIILIFNWTTNTTKLSICKNGYLTKRNKRLDLSIILDNNTNSNKLKSTSKLVYRFPPKNF